MSASRTKKKRQRTHRYTSNVFSMFNQDQIQEFKEAFNMIDQNRDGFIDKEDLIEMLTSLGKNPTDDYLDMMILEAPGPINFTMFLTLFGEKLNGTDPEDVIKNAFGCFDLKNMGFIAEDRLREIMTTMGDRWTDDKVDELFHGAPIRSGFFDYIEFTRTLKHGAKDRDDDPIDQPSPQSKTTTKQPFKPPPAEPQPPPKDQRKSIDNSAATPPKIPTSVKPLKTAMKKPQQKFVQPMVPPEKQEQDKAPPLPQSPPPDEPPTPPVEKVAKKSKPEVPHVEEKAPIQPKSPAVQASVDNPPLPNTPPSKNPFGANLKSTGRFPPFKKL